MFLTGNVRAKVYPDNNNANSRDHLVEQLAPVNTWGSEFVTVPIPRTIKLGDVFIITASENNTDIEVQIKAETGEQTLLPLSIANAGKVIVLVYIRITLSCQSSFPPLALFSMVYTCM